MSKIKQGILGAGSGKVGGVIMSSWKGIATIRSMPSTVENPNTAAQQTQRGKFSQAVACARLLLAELIRPFWDPFVKGMSGYNAFIQKNIDCFNETGFIAPSAFVAARGVLVGLSDFSATFNPVTHVLNVCWFNNTGVGDALATDLITVVWYNESKKYWKVSVGSAARSAETYDITDTNLSVGDDVHVYGFFRRPDMSKISDSTYSLSDEG